MPLHCNVHSHGWCRGGDIHDRYCRITTCIRAAARVRFKGEARISRTSWERIAIVTAACTSGSKLIQAVRLHQAYFVVAFIMIIIPRIVNMPDYLEVN